jgi:hypothetical protein
MLEIFLMFFLVSIQKDIDVIKKLKNCIKKNNVIYFIIFLK